MQFLSTHIPLFVTILLCGFPHATSFSAKQPPPPNILQQWWSQTAIAQKWDPRLSVLLNVVSLVSTAPNFSAVQEESDPAMPAHLEEIRKIHKQTMMGLPSVEIPRVVDLSVPSRNHDNVDINVRLYYPKNNNNQNYFPWMLYSHGGGWAMGSIDSHDAFCRTLAQRAEIVVVSVEYRLAPEFKHPAQRNDVEDVLAWLLEQGQSLQLDRDKIALGGDSSGGTIAAQVALSANSEGIPVRLQMLLCPALDPSCSTPSFVENANAFGLRADDMKWFWDRYLSQEEDAVLNEDASPIWLASPVENLSGLAPAFVVAGELDVLRDEARIYSDMLQERGVDVDYRCYDGAIHAFCVYANTPISLKNIALDDAVASLKQAFK